MHQIEVVLGLFLAVAALAYLAQKIRVPYPILLVVGGTVISFIPRLPHVELHPDIVFLLFLPPLLYHAALLTSWRDFKTYLRPILMLAVGLVVFTTVAIAGVAHYFVDGMSWPAAFALGAIISPPDAVAATAITQRLRVPKRVTTILEGESLVNDATALVIYRFAVTAAVAGAAAVASPSATGAAGNAAHHVVEQFSLGRATVQFFVLAIGGVAIGLAAGFVAAWVRSRIADPSVENIVSLLTPFFAYLPAEWVHVSGVLAVVTAGIVMGRYTPKVVNFRQRLRAYAIWETLEFILNGLVFILIGLQLPTVVANIGDVPIGRLHVYAALVAGTAIVVRLLWVFVATYLPRLLSPALRRHDPAPPVGHVAVIGWTGMRGVVSLAAALALPIATDTSPGFPHRDLIIFLTFAAILATLVGQGLTLPAVIRFFGLTDDGSEHKEEHIARLEGAHAAIARLQALEIEGLVSPDDAERLRRPYDDRIRLLAPDSAGNLADLDSFAPPTCATDVERELIQAERRMVTFLRDGGTIGDEVLRKVQHELDLQEAKLPQPEGAE